MELQGKIYTEIKIDLKVLKGVLKKVKKLKKEGVI